MDANKGITLSKKISGDQDADATIFGGVLSNHAGRLFEMTQSRDKTLRHAALDLIGHLLRQGQINPIETVPFLLALQGDVDEEEVRLLALKLLMIEGERRKEMLRQKFRAGVKQAYIFQSIVYPDKAEVSALTTMRTNGALHTECVFSCVFRECFMSSRKQRHGLFRDLLGLFNPSKLYSEDEEVGRLDLPLLSFASQVLAHLPYSVASDPLYIIHDISSTIALQGADLIDRLERFLRPYGLAGKDEYDESNLEEDDLEIAAKRKIPHHSKESTPLLQPGFDMTTFSRMCGEAASMCLLLRLKSFLRRAYNLSESRILGFDPEAKERIAEKASFRNTNYVFDSKLHLRSLSAIASDSELDSLIRQYAEFRQLMRAESASEVRASDSEGENQKSSKRKRNPCNALEG